MTRASPKKRRLRTAKRAAKIERLAKLEESRAFDALADSIRKAEGEHILRLIAEELTERPALS